MVDEILSLRAERDAAVARHESECASHNDTRRTLEACRDDCERYQDLAASMRARAEAAERERDKLYEAAKNLVNSVSGFIADGVERECPHCFCTGPCSPDCPLEMLRASIKDTD